MGARTLLCMAAIAPHKFGRLVVAGVGRNLFERDEAQAERIAKGVQGEADPGDVHAQTFARYATEADQDGQALAAFMRRKHYPLGESEFKLITHPVRVVLGTEDFAGPADPLLNSLSNSVLTELRGCDHLQRLRISVLSMRFLITLKLFSELHYSSYSIDEVTKIETSKRQHSLYSPLF